MNLTHKRILQNWKRRRNRLSSSRNFRDQTTKQGFKPNSFHTQIFLRSLKICALVDWTGLKHVGLYLTMTGDTRETLCWVSIDKHGVSIDKYWKITSLWPFCFSHTPLNTISISSSKLQTLSAGHTSSTLLNLTAHYINKDLLNRESLDVNKSLKRLTWSSLFKAVKR